MNPISEKLLDIISSDIFKKNLEKININYPNVKQELVIRDSLLEIFNSENTIYKAFAEVIDTDYIKTENSHRSRVDLLIKCLDDLNESHKTEIKFFFNKDIKSGKEHSIFKNFETKTSDLLLIIVQEFDVALRKKYLQNWNIFDSLSKYQSKKINENRFDTLIFNLKAIQNAEYKLLQDIKVEKPYPTTYKFFCLIR